MNEFANPTPEPWIDELHTAIALRGADVDEGGVLDAAFLATPGKIVPAPERRLVAARIEEGVLGIRVHLAADRDHLPIDVGDEFDQVAEGHGNQPAEVYRLDALSKDENLVRHGRPPGSRIVKSSRSVATQDACARRTRRRARDGVRVEASPRARRVA